MKKLILILIIIHSSLLIAQAQWIKQFSPNHDLRDIEFINRYTGWTCGDNFIYKTTDGGTTWDEQIHPNVTYFTQIFPVNKNVVYAVGLWNFLKTTDGGENWITIFSGGTGQGLPDLEGLYFINENTGWLVGNVVAMKTTNGGISFTDSMRIEEISQDVYFKDSLNGILCGYSGGFRKTTNGGKSWDRIQVLNGGPLYDFYRLSVFNDSIVWVGSKPLYRSIDFGQSWDSISLFPFSGINDYTYNIDFSSALTGYACGRSIYLYKTTDGGYNWMQQQTSQSTQRLYLGMSAFNDSIVWCCGRKIILNTYNGGMTRIFSSSASPTNNFKLNQNFPNPFNPITFINYELEYYSHIRISIYDILGSKIINLVNEKQDNGTYNVLFDGISLPSGVYFYSLYVNDNLIDTRKMLLIK